MNVNQCLSASAWDKTFAFSALARCITIKMLCNVSTALKTITWFYFSRSAHSYTDDKQEQCLLSWSSGKPILVQLKQSGSYTFDLTFRGEQVGLCGHNAIRHLTGIRGQACDLPPALFMTCSYPAWAVVKKNCSKTLGQTRFTPHWTACAGIV